jgi:hypothetical protein
MGARVYEDTIIIISQCFRTQEFMIRATTRDNKPSTSELSAQPSYRRSDLVDSGEDEDCWESGFETRGEDGVEEEYTHWRRGGVDVHMRFVD